MTPPGLLLGAHESIAGTGGPAGRLSGPGRALLRGREAGCDTVQIFCRAPNRWQSKPFTTEQVAAFHQARAETGIWPVFAHGSYLLNLATPDDELWNRSVDALAGDLECCEQLGLPGLVIHPGSHMDSGEQAGLDRIGAALDEVHTRQPGYRAQVWLEITAGQGNGLGSSLAQLQAMIDRVRTPERLGICFDTAHAFAAGYELRTPEGYEAIWAEFEALLGLDRLRAIHLNDSKADLGSRVDRHEQIGQGRLGLEPFRLLVNDPRLRGIPMVLETEKKPDLGEDKENLALLRSLVSAQT